MAAAAEIEYYDKRQFVGHAQVALGHIVKSTMIDTPSILLQLRISIASLETRSSTGSIPVSKMDAPRSRETQSEPQISTCNRAM
jgi:hypothetical protein